MSDLRPQVSKGCRGRWSEVGRRFCMADTFQLEIVTPEKKVVDTAAEEAQIPGKNGYLGVLPGHAPLITELAVGAITFRAGASEQRLAGAWGIAQVLPDKVAILAESAPRPSDINVE